MQPPLKAPSAGENFLIAGVGPAPTQVACIGGVFSSSCRIDCNFLNKLPISAVSGTDPWSHL
jgi:hypothetical protein